MSRRSKTQRKRAAYEAATRVKPYAGHRFRSRRRVPWRVFLWLYHPDRLRNVHVDFSRSRTLQLLRERKPLVHDDMEDALIYTWRSRLTLAIPKPDPRTFIWIDNLGDK